jgi:hypothetical protein
MPDSPPTYAQNVLFSMREISNATNIPVQTLCGVSYAAFVLDIPLSDGHTLRFREGDDPETDHEVAVL